MRAGAGGRFDTALGFSHARGPLAWLGRAAVYLVLGLVFAGPLLALLVGAFSRVPDPTQLSLWPDQLTMDNFTRAIERDVLRYLLNSFLVVGGGLLLQIGVSVSAAYALARKRFPGLRLVFLLILSIRPPLVDPAPDHLDQLAEIIAQGRAALARLGARAAA